MDTSNPATPSDFTLISYHQLAVFVTVVFVCLSVVTFTMIAVTAYRNAQVRADRARYSNRSNRR